MPAKADYDKDPDRYREQSRAWYAANAERAKAQNNAYQRANREKCRESQRKWCAKNRAKRTEYAVAYKRKRLGFDRGAFVAKMAEQRGLCAICSIPLTTGLGSASACADHCHETNKPRGILCKRCNLLIGHARDDVGILSSAISYLSAWATTPAANGTA